MKCSCYKCNKEGRYTEVPESIEEHFTAHDGRILCTSCCKGVEPCSDRIKKLLIQASS